MRLLFAGTSDIGIPSLRAVAAEHELVGLLTQPDRPTGRHHRLTPPATKAFLSDLSPSTPVFQPERLREPSVMEELRALHPDVIVTMSYGKILPRELLELPSLACINVHASLLPRYRGATPIQGALLSGDLETGITIMYMAEGLDTGDLLLHKKIPLSPEETAGTLTERLANLAPAPLLEALKLLQEKKAPRLPQEESEVTFTHRITRENSLMDTSRPAIELERFIRAMNPKPGAYGSFLLPSGTTIALKIFSSRVMNTDTGAPPGSLVLSQNQELLLQCGQHSLALQEIQPEGRSRMSASAFLLGYFQK